MRYIALGRTARAIKTTANTKKYPRIALAVLAVLAGVYAYTHFSGKSGGPPPQKPLAVRGGMAVSYGAAPAGSHAQHETGAPGNRQ